MRTGNLEVDSILQEYDAMKSQCVCTEFNCEVFRKALEMAASKVAMFSEMVEKLGEREAVAIMVRAAKRELLKGAKQ
jgi:hypothetical protein